MQKKIHKKILLEQPNLTAVHMHAFVATATF